MFVKATGVMAVAFVLAGSAFAGPKQAGSKNGAFKGTAVANKCATTACTCPGGKAACDPAKCAACCSQKACPATGAKTSNRAATAVRQLSVCPVGLETVSKTAKRYTYGTYQAAFCCTGCKATFDKLSKAEQQQKLAIAAKRS